MKTGKIIITGMFMILAIALFNYFLYYPTVLDRVVTMLDNFLTWISTPDAKEVIVSRIP